MVHVTVWSALSFLLRAAAWRRNAVWRLPTSMRRRWACARLPTTRSHRIMTYKCRMGSWVKRMVAVHIGWTRSLFAVRRTGCFLVSL